LGGTTRYVDDDFMIEEIHGRLILDSRGNPTVEVDVITVGGAIGRAAAPAGKSRGRYEAVELRDLDKSKYRGMSVYKAVEIINNDIASLLEGMDCREQEAIDRTMIEYDGTPNKSKLGANTMVATSLAVAKAAAEMYGLPLFMYIGGINARVLPVPIMNILNGGKHAGNELSIQEFMIIPVNADSFSEALRIGVEIYHTLRDFLTEKYGKIAVNVGDEGGFAPPMRQTREALDALMKAIDMAGYSEEDAKLGLDCAASTFFDARTKRYFLDGKELSEEELMDFYLTLLKEYPIIYLEDPFEEEAFETFSLLTRETKGVLVVGDDLFVTNPKRFRIGIEKGACNAILVKVNQIGTLTETMEVIDLAKTNGYRAVISHRSGETEDSTIADLAVGFSTGLIKTGAPARGERTAKYNQLLRIEEYLGDAARFLGIKAFK